MNKRQFTVTLVSIIIFAFFGGMLSVELFSGFSMNATEKKTADIQGFSLKENQFIGVVENGKFRLLAPHLTVVSTIRLTCIQMQEARPPETDEIDLKEYEGRAVMVTGHGSGSWIYMAKVIDTAGPLVTTLIQKVFNQSRLKSLCFRASERAF